MPIFNAVSTHTAAKLSWTRLLAVNATLVLAALSMSSSADAAVGCAAKTPHHAAPTRCQAHRLPAGFHAAAPAKAPVRAASVARIDSGEVVLSGPTFSAHANLAPVAARSQPPMTAELPIDRRAAPAASQPSDLPGDLFHGDNGGVPAAPAPAAWSILLAGLLGLGLLSRQPVLAQARSWATTMPASASGRSGIAPQDQGLRHRSGRPRPLCPGSSPPGPPGPFPPPPRPPRLRRLILKPKRLTPLDGTDPKAAITIGDWPAYPLPPSMR